MSIVKSPDAIRRSPPYLGRMIDPSQLPDNEEAERVGIIELELDAAVILRFEHELTEEP